MWSAVSKSGSPISRWMMSRPCASSAFAFARTENAVSVPRRPIRPASFTSPSLSRCAWRITPRRGRGIIGPLLVAGERPRLRGFDEGRPLVAERNAGLPFDLGAFDLDGTLLRFDLEITARTLTAVEGLRERGMRLVVATGRRYESAVEHAEKLGFGEEDPVVCYGGSMVRRMDGETLLHRTLPKELGLEVLEWAAGRDLHARVFVDGRVITSPNSPAALRFSKRLEEPGIVVVDSPAEWLAGAQDGRAEGRRGGR